MTRTATVLSIAIGILSAVSLAAQTRPDFSGRWTSEPETAAAPAGTQSGAGGGGAARAGDMGSGWGPNITITQGAGRLTVEYAFFAPADLQPPLRFVFALDGAETKNTVMMGRGLQAQTSRAAWEGDKLVITTTHGFAHPETGRPLKSEVKQTLALESPSSLVVETTRGGVLGGPPSTTRTVYRRL